MIAIVTGATGLVGGTLVQELVRGGWDVTCLSRRFPAAPDSRVHWKKADLFDPEGMAAALEASGPAAVLFHLAAVMPGPPDAGDESYFRGNVLSSRRLFQAAQTIGIQRIVYASSVSVIGAPKDLPITEDHPARPLTAYATSKLVAELYADLRRRTAGVPITSLRFSSIYGPSMRAESVLPHFVKLAVEGRPLRRFGSGRRSQNFLHVRDAVRALMLAAAAPSSGIYNIAGAQAVSMNALAELVLRLVPATTSRLESDGTPDPQEDQRWDVDLRRARGELGYAPAVPLEEGLADYIAHITRHSII